MNYFEIISGKYVVSIGTSNGAVGHIITKERFNAIKTAISEKPIAEAGYAYKLVAETLEWELVEVPIPPEPTPDPDPELDDTTALFLLLGGES